MKNNDRPANNGSDDGWLSGLSNAGLKTMSIFLAAIGASILLVQLLADSDSLAGWISGVCAILLSLKLLSELSKRKRGA